MSLFVLDTVILSLLQRGHPVVTRRCGSHPPGDLAITVISTEEQISGWYTVLRKAKTAGGIDAGLPEPDRQRPIPCDAAHSSVEDWSV
jgi:hypothetical protein